MTDFSINTFGNLTSKTGKAIQIDLNEIKKFDENGDNRISEEELDNYIKSLNDDFDQTEVNKLFRALDKDSSADVDSEEFEVYEQKITMQSYANEKIAQAARDTNLSSHAANIRDELKDYIETFASSYKGNVSSMAESFKTALETKFESVKAGIKANDPATIQEKVLEEFNKTLSQSFLTRSSSDGTTLSEDVSDTAKKRILTLLEKEANNFRASYKGNSFEADLRAHLESYLKTSDSSKMSTAVTTLNTKINSYGDYISSSELTSLKADVTEFLKEAVKQGVTINLGGTNVKSEAGIKSALAKFTTGEELISAIKSAISELSSIGLIDQVVSEAKANAEKEELTNFTSISGESYKINSSLIDFSKVDSRYFSGESIHQRGKGWSGSKDKAYDEGYNILTSDGLKSQIRAQIEKMLKEKGVSFEKVEQVFENVYNQTAQDVLNSEGMITGRGARGLSRKGHAYINVKDLCDNFITKFNENISTAINEMNASQTDFDTIDLDFSSEVLNKTEDEDGNKTEIKDGSGNVVTDDFAQAYASGKVLTTKKHGADYYVTIAEQIIDGLRSQMLSKAKAMCQANGVEFDLSSFSTMFNNAKSIAVNAAVTGITSKGKSVGGITGGAGSAAAGAAGAIVATDVIETCIGGSTLLEFSAAASAIPAAGWIVAGAGALTALGFALFSGHSSSSSLDTKTLVDTFTQNFKENFTNWVEEEKNKSKGA